MPVRGHGCAGFEPAEGTGNHCIISFPTPSPISNACQLSIAPYVLHRLSQLIIVPYESVKILALPESSGATENFIGLFRRE